MLQAVKNPSGGHRTLTAIEKRKSNSGRGAHGRVVRMKGRGLGRQDRGVRNVTSPQKGRDVSKPFLCPPPRREQNSAHETQEGAKEGRTWAR